MNPTQLNHAWLFGALLTHHVVIDVDGWRYRLNPQTGALESRHPEIDAADAWSATDAAGRFGIALSIADWGAEPCEHDDCSLRVKQ